MLAQLPARYRTPIRVVGLLSFTLVSAWLAALTRGPLLTPTDLVIAAGVGLAVGIPAVNAFLTLQCGERQSSGPPEARAG